MNTDFPESLLFPSKLFSSTNTYHVYINSPQLNSDIETNEVSTTKYQWYSFFPKMLMEQLSRTANVYFLLIAILQSIKAISFTAGIPLILMPLSIVVFINGIKDFFEDSKRKKSDNHENNSKCLVYDSSTKSFTRKKWKEIRLGDIVKVKKGESFPSDLILLNSSEPSGICFIETKNIDGETSLKYRQANKTIKDLCPNDEGVANVNFICLTKPPNEFIYQFDATLYEVENGQVCLGKPHLLIDKNSFLLRGCSLQQTDYIIGAAIYIGHNTKSVINSPNAHTKTSTIERIMNLQIVISFGLLVVLSAIAGCFHITYYSLYFDNFKNYIFVDEKKMMLGEVFALNTGIWILLISNFVPISLLVTLETIKFLQAVMMYWDIEMYDRERQVGATIQTSTLNEELGQVQYIFSDKTGTLTKNYMEFKAISIGNEIYGEYTLDRMTTNALLPDFEKKAITDDYGTITNVNFVDKYKKLDMDYNNNVNNQKDNINHFMLCLALCNTVITDVKEFETNKILNYQATSPDEKSLIYFARSQGYVFLNRSIENEVKIKMRNGPLMTYKILHILEYSSERKRMSVLVRCPDGKVVLYAKGADSVISSLVTANMEQLQKTNQHLTTFAVKGLRTLMIAYRELSDHEYNDWDKQYQEIALDSNRKEKELPRLYELIEKDFKVLGATGIEDQLQDNVEETLDSFIKIGIKVWMLTGDKMDTAKNIAISCKLFNEDMTIIEIPEQDSLNDLKRKLQADLNSMKTNKKDYGLLISSEEIELIFNHQDLVDLFTQICVKSKSVVCSRVSPKQKAEVVSLIKNSQKVITLAIGDGANDVGMITEANIGIGIHGVEGTQAARASDYSITQFAHLQRLLFYHGREAYRRNSFVICFNFYKNLIFVTPHLWAGFINCYSGQNLFEPWLYQLYNAVFTAIPIGWYGVLDLEYAPDMLATNGKYYVQGMYGKLFHYKRFWKWVVFGMLEGMCLLFFGFNGMNSISSNGKDQDMWSIGNCVYAGVVVLANLTIIINTNTHNLVTACLNIFSILSFFITNIIQSRYSRFANLGSTQITLSDIKFYLVMFEVNGAILLMDIFIKKMLILIGFVAQGDQIESYGTKYKKVDFCSPIKSKLIVIKAFLEIEKHFGAEKRETLLNDSFFEGQVA